MGDRDHCAYHRSLVERNQHWQSPEFEQKRLAALAGKAATQAGYEYYAARGTRNILNYMQQKSEHFQQAVAGNGKRGQHYLVQYNQSDKGRKKSQEIANRYYTCDICNAQIKTPIGLHNHRKKEHQCDRKVLAVLSF
ncbi:hypothetical protein AB0758_30695 [Tolypothrix bouteillei VB521301_2]|uniref:hypothetical protein n=1 Tax=Tolypothrix bouteillei TaxID=1246981 RepID=UPI0038B54E48